VLVAAWRRCCHPRGLSMKSSGRRRPSGRPTQTNTLPSTVHMVRLPKCHNASPCCSQSLSHIHSHKHMHKATAALQLVHCCAGFNRTGFIMCSYLCEAEGMTVDDALDSFAAVRPPGVKHGETRHYAQWCSAACRQADL
jgi:Dual specificity phosphatase, catalytic domain